MKRTFLLVVLNLVFLTMFAQQVISNGEDIGIGWWPAGSAGSVDISDNPLKDGTNSTDKAMTVWINNADYLWTGGGMGGLNIDVNSYNCISLMVYKLIPGKVQLEIHDDIHPNVYLQQDYTTPGHWQKLVFEIPEGLGNIKTILVAPHFENSVLNPIPDGEAHRMWWDEIVAYYDPNTISALYTKEALKTSIGETLNYRKLSPTNIDNGEKYPLVIFLHGAGERGSDNIRQLAIGANLFAKNRNEYPAFVLFPQCPTKYFWPFDTDPSSTAASTFPVNYPISHAIQGVKELIDKYIQKDEIDKQRVYVVGLSMGGMGTYDIVCRFPEIFAAAIPICGGVNVQRLNNSVKDIYWRIFHGDSDTSVPVKNSRDAYYTLNQLGADVEYIEFKGVNHDSWNSAFEQADFLPWLYSKTKKKRFNEY